MSASGEASRVAAVLLAREIGFPNKSPRLQVLHAGGGTRTPDTRIMMTASRGPLRLN